MISAQFATLLGVLLPILTLVSKSYFDRWSNKRQDRVDPLNAVTDGASKVVASAQSIITTLEAQLREVREQADKLISELEATRNQLMSVRIDNARLQDEIARLRATMGE